ncbi:MAG: ABC transporter permease [Desulfurococcaceae archaeon]|jgi:ABC-type dipeptide/oligopeptide/nickel transport system permease component|nr:ABC transporter permease [Desulfurococcaceae archaeon]
MGLLTYITKKLLIGIPVIFGVTIILFYIMYILPGDPIQLLLSGERVTPERVEELRRAWGLDQPVYVQYFYWLSRIIRGDLGISIVTKQPVSLLILQRLPYTLALMLTSILLSYVIGVLTGIITALKRGSLLDSILSTSSIICYSIPGFWFGLILMLIFAYYLRLFPVSGYEGWHSLILPALSLALPSSAYVMRLTRAEMIEVLGEDYIRTAWAKGLSKRRVLLVHALRNAIIPVVTMFFLDLPWLMGGAVVIETLFALPGMGRLLYVSILKQDYPVVQGIVLIITILTVVCNTLGDVVIAILDPRIRFERGRSV